MNKIITESLELLKNRKIEKYEDICSSIISFSKYGEEQKAKELIKYITKFQTKEGCFQIKNKIYVPLSFLEAITQYLINLSKNNKIENDQINKNEIQIQNLLIKKELLNIYPFIFNSIQYIKKNFSNNYLLVFNSLNNSEKKYLANENAKFLNFCDDLLEILNTYNYIKEADTLFILKTRIELGFNRYFYNNLNKALISKFNEEGKIKISTELDYLKILNKYQPNKTLFEKYKFEMKKGDLNKLEKKLLYLLLIKKNNLKKFNLELKKLDKEIMDKKPKCIWDKEYFNLYLELSKSINKEFNIEFAENKKSKEVYVKLNNIRTINLILELFD